MKILVTAESKQGTTTEIANAIGEALRRLGLEVTVALAEQVDLLDGYDAYVLGSAVYAGHWLKPAIDLVEKEDLGFTSRPVVLFANGPIGDPPKPEEDPVDKAEIKATTSARDHVLVAKKLDKSMLGFAERAMVIAFRAPFKDFRDWDDIESWAARIADELAETRRPGRIAAATAATFDDVSGVIHIHPTLAAKKHHPLK